MSFWDHFKKRYEQGKPAPREGDWAAMEALIESEPALKPARFRVAVFRRGLILLLLLLSSGTGPSWELLAPGKPFLPGQDAPKPGKKDPERQAEKRLIQNPFMLMTSSEADTLHQKRSPTQDDNPAPIEGYPQQENPTSETAIKRKMASASPSSRKIAPVAATVFGRKAFKDQEAAPSRYSIPNLPELSFRERHPFSGSETSLPPLNLDGLERDDPSISPGHNSRNQWSLGWSGQLETNWQGTSHRRAQGPLVRYRMGNWSVQSGWLRGQGREQNTRRYSQESFRVDSSQREEISINLEMDVQRRWVVDSFFQGAYRYDTLFRLRRDTIYTWQRDTTRIKTTASQREKVRFSYQSLPLLAGYHWDWGRWELLLQAGTRLERGRYTTIEGSKKELWRFSAQIRPHLLYHLSPHWQVGLGAGWSQPLDIISNDSWQQRPTGQLSVQLFYQW